VSRNRRGTSTNYHLHLGAGQVDGITLPSTLKTNATVCHAVSPNVSTLFVLGRGALGLPWIRELTVGVYTWQS
jgi:hypothetical protein